MNDDEKKKDEKFTQLRTMVPTDVYLELTEMCKARETFTGAWDYGNAIRELLWAYKVFFNVSTRLDQLEIKVDSVASETATKALGKDTEELVEDDKKNDLLGGHSTKRD